MCRVRLWIPRRSPATRRLRRRRLEPSPVLHDLIERNFSVPAEAGRIAWSVIGNRPLPRFDRLRVLTTVLVEVSDQVASRLAFVALAARDDRLDAVWLSGFCVLDARRRS